jgi:hypothetical protein
MYGSAALSSAPLAETANVGLATRIRTVVMYLGKVVEWKTNQEEEENEKKSI